MIILTGGGKHTREYKVVLRNLSTITNTLECNHKGKENLMIKFKEKEWIDPYVTECSEQELVLNVLRRIELDMHTLDEFIEMLRNIVGLEQIVDVLTSLK